MRACKLYHKDENSKLSRSTIKEMLVVSNINFCLPSKNNFSLWPFPTLVISRTSEKHTYISVPLVKRLRILFQEHMFLTTSTQTCICKYFPPVKRLKILFQKHMIATTTTVKVPKPVQFKTTRNEITFIDLFTFLHLNFYTPTA